MEFRWKSSSMPSPSLASSQQVRCAGTKPSRTRPRSLTTCSGSLQFLILGATSLLMLIQVRSAALHSALVTQAKAGVSPKLSSRQASPVVASASESLLRRAKRRALVLMRARCRREPMTTRCLAPQALPPRPLKPSAETAEHVARAVEALAERGASELVAEARVKGYEGEACGECGNFTLVRNGTCLKCDTCGSTSGCS